VSSASCRKMYVPKLRVFITSAYPAPFLSTPLIYIGPCLHNFTPRNPRHNPTMETYPAYLYTIRMLQGLLSIGLILCTSYAVTHPAYWLYLAEPAACTIITSTFALLSLIFFLGSNAVGRCHQRGLKRLLWMGLALRYLSSAW
jgi:hypothetical protein